MFDQIGDADGDKSELVGEQVIRRRDDCGDLQWKELQEDDDHSSPEDSFL